MKKTFELFINFDGECREAVDFYANAFSSKVVDLMSYSDAPADPSYPIADADKNKVMYASVNIFGCDVMFSDLPSDMPLVKGNNISPTISTTDKEELKRVFAALSVGGSVEMEIQQTFWSEMYGMVVDKFGVIWQLMYDNSEVQ